jgi:uncharacterized membrane protein YuzA (DUF378 family)
LRGALVEVVQRPAKYLSPALQERFIIIIVSAAVRLRQAEVGSLCSGHPMLQVRAHERDPTLISRGVETKSAVCAGRMEQPVPAFPRAQEVGADTCSSAQLTDPELLGRGFHPKHSTDIEQTLDKAALVLYDLWTNSEQKGAHVKKLDILAAVLLVVGGLNWGLVAVADFDLVAALFGLDFGETNAASRVIYGLVGLAAVYQVVQQGAIRRRWSRNPHVITA